MLLGMDRTTHAYPCGDSQKHSTHQIFIIDALYSRVGACYGTLCIGVPCGSSLRRRTLEQFFQFLRPLGDPFVPVLERLATFDILDKGVKIPNDGGIIWEFG
jgi:hypothetical protein